MESRTETQGCSVREIRGGAARKSSKQAMHRFGGGGRRQPSKAEGATRARGKWLAESNAQLQEGRGLTGLK